MMVQVQKKSLHEFAQILRTTKFKQIRNRLRDSENGRCAIGVIADHYGFLGKNQCGYVFGEVDKMVEWEGPGTFTSFIADRNDTDKWSFDEIADWLDKL